jgi:hypothetical protein
MEMPPDSATSEEKGGRGYWGSVIWPVVVVMVYVLSAGPAAYAMRKRALASWVAHVYDPLGLVLNGTGLMRPFRMYLHLWVPDVYDKNGRPIDR